MFYLLEKNQFPKTVCKNTTSTTGESRECFYCHEPGHLIAVSPVVRKKEHKTGKPPAGMGFVAPVQIAPQPEPQANADIDPRFKPFVSFGFVSLSTDSEKVPITIIPETAASFVYSGLRLATFRPDFVFL